MVSKHKQEERGRRRKYEKVISEFVEIQSSLCLKARDEPVSH